MTALTFAPHKITGKSGTWGVKDVENSKARGNETVGRVELIRDHNGNVVWMDEDEAIELAEFLNHGPLVIEAHICKERRGYQVTFEGTDEQIDARATEWIQARMSTHAVQVDGIRSNVSRFPRLQDLLFPICEHGLSLDLCYGPNHY